MIGKMISWLLFEFFSSPIFAILDFCTIGSEVFLLLPYLEDIYVYIYFFKSNKDNNKWDKDLISELLLLYFLALWPKMV